MATRFEFYLSEEDTERLFAIKEDENKNDLTGNEFAKELLSGVLHRMHPGIVRYDENGDRIKR